jgi:hypothetical protein
MGIEWIELFGEELVGYQYERAAVGCAMGIGVQWGATGTGDGEGDAHAAEREWGMLPSCWILWQ